MWVCDPPFRVLKVKFYVLLCAGAQQFRLLLSIKWIVFDFFIYFQIQINCFFQFRWKGIFLTFFYFYFLFNFKKTLLRPFFYNFVAFEFIL